MKKLTLLAISYFCLVSSLFAQLDVTLPSLRRVYQSSYTNPAFMPKYKTSIGIPVLSNLQFDITRTGFTLQDIFDCVDDQGLVDANQFYNKIEGEGIAIQTTLNTDIFHVSFNIKGFQIGINSSLKTQNNQLFGKDFIGFIANGNDFYRGKTAQVDFLLFNTLKMDFLFQNRFENFLLVFEENTFKALLQRVLKIYDYLSLLPTIHSIQL
jgi:hypothetical protein